MLVLSRKKDETLMIGDDIEITIIEIEDGKVKIGIEAPKTIKVNRKEIFDKIKDENNSSLQSTEKLKELKKFIK